MAMTTGEKVEDHDFLIAVLKDMTRRLRMDGELLATDRTVFLPSDADETDKVNMPTLLETLEGYLEERE